MIYLSQVLGRPILDLEGERVATLKDVIVRLGEGDHPPAAGFLARYRRRDFFLARWRISDFGEHRVRLNTDILEPRPFLLPDSEIPLVRDVRRNRVLTVARMRGGRGTAAN